MNAISPMSANTHGLPASARTLTRWQAAGRHLLVSVGVATIATLLVAFVWYPPPFLISARGHEMLAILLAVDVVLGPLLTLAVYKAGKWGMKFDLIVIALLQISGLLYGMHIVSQARPAFIVHAVDQFELVAASEIGADAYRTGAPGFTSPPWTGPRLVYAELPSGKAAGDLIFSVLAGGADLHQLPQYFRPFDKHAAKVLPRSRSVADLPKFNPGQDARVAKEIERAGRPASELRYVPLKSRKGDLTVFVDGKTGAVIHIAELQPW
jgi:hypothetical protein